jgi:hypothetical protein
MGASRHSARARIIGRRAAGLDPGLVTSRNNRRRSWCHARMTVLTTDRHRHQIDRHALPLMLSLRSRCGARSRYAGVIQ